MSRSSGIPRPIRAAPYAVPPPPSLPAPPSSATLRPTKHARPSMGRENVPPVTVGAGAASRRASLVSAASLASSMATTYEGSTVSSRARAVAAGKKTDVRPPAVPLAPRAANSGAPAGHVSRVSPQPSFNVCPGSADMDMKMVSSIATGDGASRAATPLDPPPPRRTDAELEDELAVLHRHRLTLRRRSSSARAQYRLHKTTNAPPAVLDASRAACLEPALAEAENCRRAEEIRHAQLVEARSEVRAKQRMAAALAVALGRAGAQLDDAQFDLGEAEARIAAHKRINEQLAAENGELGTHLEISKQARAVAEGQAAELQVASAALRAHTEQLARRNGELEQADAERRCAAAAARVAAEPAEARSNAPRTSSAAVAAGAVVPLTHVGRRAGPQVVGVLVRHRLAAAAREASARRGAAGWLSMLRWW